MGKRDLEILKSRASKYLESNGKNNAFIENDIPNKNKNDVQVKDRDISKKSNLKGKDYSKTWVRIYVTPVGTKR